MKSSVLLTLCFALSITGCAAANGPTPAASPTPSAAPPTVAPGEPGSPGPGVVSADPKSPPEFERVDDRGLVTAQHRALFPGGETTTIRVASDGSWSRTGTKPSAGRLDDAQLASLRKLVDEAARSTPSVGQGLPCDAEPAQESRVLFPDAHELGWAGPCAGPPPPKAIAILSGYLDQVANGRPAAELERYLAQPR